MCPILLLLKLPRKVMKYSTKNVYNIIYREPTLVLLLVVSDLCCSVVVHCLISYSDYGDLYGQVSWDSVMERKRIIKPDLCWLLSKAVTEHIFKVPVKVPIENSHSLHTIRFQMLPPARTWRERTHVSSHKADLLPVCSIREGQEQTYVCLWD